MSTSIIRTISLILFSTLSIQYTVLACSCGEPVKVFCAGIYENSNIISAVVVEDTLSPQYMKVRILENIYNGFQQDTITVLGQDGLNCGEDLIFFNPQDTLIFSLTKWGDENYLDGCTKSYLYYRNGIVYGHVRDTIYEQRYDEFKNQIEECIDFKVSIDEEYSVSFDVFPNPAQDILYITTVEIPYTEISILDINGRLIEVTENSSGYQSQIRISELQNGVYYILLRTSDTILKRKIVKL